MQVEECVAGVVPGILVPSGLAAGAAPSDEDPAQNPSDAGSDVATATTAERRRYRQRAPRRGVRRGDPRHRGACAVGACPTFTACGGNPKGTWLVSGGCVSDELVQTAQAQCAGLTVKDGSVVVKAKGSLVVSASSIERRTQFSVAATINIPQDCASQAGGNCALVGLFLKSAAGGGFDSATCTSDGSGGCDCAIGTQVQDVGTSSYTQSGADDHDGRRTELRVLPARHEAADATDRRHPRRARADQAVAARRVSRREEPALRRPDLEHLEVSSVEGGQPGVDAPRPLAAGGVDAELLNRVPHHHALRMQRREGSLERRAVVGRQRLRVETEPDGTVVGVDESRACGAPCRASSRAPRRSSCRARRRRASEGCHRRRTLSPTFMKSGRSASILA